jgi:hypothetical protein
VSKHESTHQAWYDNCAWCSKEIIVPDLAWRDMVSTEGLAIAANYCMPTAAERAGHTDGLSRCRRTGFQNMHTIAVRLKKQIAEQGQASESAEGEAA